MKRLLALLLLLNAATVHAAPLPLRQTSGEVWIAFTKAGHNEGIGFMVCYVAPGHANYYDVPAGVLITIGGQPVSESWWHERRVVDNPPSIAKARNGTILHRNGVVHAIHLEADK